MRFFSAVVLLVSSTVFANASGAIGYSGGPPGNTNCNGCHTGGTAPSVSITGPTTLAAGATGMFTFTITGGAGSRAGMNISTSGANAVLNPVSTTVGLAFGELHQKAPVTFPASFQFSLTTPFAGLVKIHAAGNSCNGNGSTGGDLSSSTTFDVTVTAGSGANPPAITTPAAAMFTTVTSRSVDVTVGANDDGTEANLSYTWSATGPAPVTFTPNGNNASKASLAAFTQEGAYMLTVTVRDGLAQMVTSTVAVTVSPTYALLRMTPVSAQVAPGANLQFVVTARDQFDAPLTTQPTVIYALPGGGGTISATGLLKAQSSAGTGFVATATASPIATAASFGVGLAPSGPKEMVPPTVSLVSPSTPNVALADGLMLEATAFDNTGVAEVRFAVAAITVATVTSGPPWKIAYVTKPGLPAGSQALEAVARDIAGNEARSTSIPVMVPVSATGGGAGGSGGTGGAGAGTGGGSGTGGSGGFAGAGGTGGGTQTGPCGCSAVDFGMGAIALLGLIRRRRR